MMSTPVLLVLLLSLVGFSAAEVITLPITASYQSLTHDRYARSADYVPLSGDLVSLIATVAIQGRDGIFRMQVDTGSQITAIVSTNCQCQFPPVNQYNPLNTSAISCTSAQCKIGQPGECNTCDFSQSYLSGQSIAGTFYNGDFILDNKTANIPYGLITKQTKGSFGALADGIMGLGRVSTDNCNKTRGDVCIPNILQSYASVSSGSLKEMFAVTIDFAQNGKLVLGGDDPSLYVAPLVRLPMYSDTLYYTAGNAIAVGNTDLGVTNQDLGNTLFDTGAAYIIFPGKVFDLMTQAFQKNFPNVSGITGNNNIFRGGYTETNITDLLPPIVFTLEDQQFLMSPYAYIITEVINSRIRFKLAIARLDTAGFPTTILGLPFLRGKYVLHDCVNKQVGIANLFGVYIPTSSSSSSTGVVYTTITSTTTGEITSDAVAQTGNALMLLSVLAMSIIMALF